MTHSAYLETMKKDILATAERLGVPAKPESIDALLRAYPDGFEETATEYRSANKPLERRGLSYRFVDQVNIDRDPYGVAVREGLLTPTDHPVYGLVNQVSAKCELDGWGVDAEVNYGLEKIWVFLKHGYPVEMLEELDTFPDSARKLIPVMKEHGLGHFSIVGADYHHESCNVYFLIHDPAVAAYDNIKKLCDSQGLVWDHEVGEYASKGICINLSFDWKHEGAIRFCNYLPALPGTEVPDWGEPFGTLLTDTPTLAPERQFIVGPTFTPNGQYVKLEVDYSGTILGALKRCLDALPLT